ncbi:hypothetical protein GUJ93_ZPchr0007g4695 [Zizania palustris]|uniref:Uncharacterized protein n=1 Tax=Zizania palustris TaxID=103762 RepID=A0A8J5T984_ZIZPA|nr:hypothetical protein GUJ93_ZPchr0007g4695 [Zizania palustris]
MKIKPSSKTKPHPSKSSSKKTAGAPAKKAPKKVATATKTLLPHRFQARGVVPMSTRLLPKNSTESGTNWGLAFRVRLSENASIQEESNNGEEMRFQITGVRFFCLHLLDG